MRGAFLGRRGLLGSVSAAAMLGGGLVAAAPAVAQVGPGSAQCPLVTDTVTCSGDVGVGFRSDRNADITRLLFRNLTTPIAPTNGRPGIDVRPIGDLTLDLDASVMINSTNPGSSFPYTWNGESNSPDAAVVLLFDPARQTTAAILNAGTVNATGTVDLFDQNAGAYFIANADIANFTNSGTITATYTVRSALSFGGDVNRRLMSGVRIVGADQIAFRNDGTIRNTGIQTFGVFLEGRSVQLINAGQIITTYDDPGRRDGGATFGPRPTGAIAIATSAAPALLEWRNTGTIRAVDSTRTTGFREAGDSYLALYGRGTINILNSGALVEHGMTVTAAAQNRTDDLTMTVENSGSASFAQMLFGTGLFDGRILAGRTSIWGERAARPASVEYRNVDIQVLNTGTLTTSRLAVNASGDTVRVEVTNRGAFDGRAPSISDFFNFFNDPVTILGASGIAPLTGRATVRLINEGNFNLTLNDTTNVGRYLVSAFSSHNAELINSGNLTLASGSGEAMGVRLFQGEDDRSPGATRSYVFDGSAVLRNSGSIEITGINENAQQTGKYGLYAGAVSDLIAANSGAIRITHDERRDPYTSFGALFQSYGNISFDNNASITITSAATANISDGIGIMLVEASLKTASATSVQTQGRARGYDRNRDLASRLTLNLNAGDVTINAPGGIGVYGVLGLTRDANESIDDDFFSFDTIENGNASAVVNIASGVSVRGGSGSGAGINFDGAGRVTVANAGSVASRGDATSGGILLGRLITESNYGLAPTPAAGLTLNLVDSLNTGEILGGGGRGIWVQTGAITNFVNRGQISGSVAAIQARDASQIDNQFGGNIDGAIVLSGAGSTLRNGGSIRVPSGAATTSSINGTFTQVAGATLSLRAIDRFNVSGNLVLGGDLILTLGAPSNTAILTTGGNLTLDANLRVADGGGFGQGVYRLIDYAGTLSGSGMTVGSLPSGRSGTVQTAIVGQINLVVSGADPGPGPGPGPDPGPTPEIQFWDGANTTANNAVEGGSGTWNNSATNWTRPNGDVNEAWGSRFAVFQGTAGTVTVDAAGIAATGLQFAVNGYTLTGGTLNLATPATLRVGDGSAAGAAYTATINNVIAGTAGIEKTDLGTLILGGANTYAGGTRVSSGVLQVSADTNLGAAAGGVALEGGTLRAGGAFSSARAFTIGAGGGTIDTQANTLTLSGILDGAGALTKAGSGTLVLSGNSAGFAGATTISGGLLNVSGSLGGTLTVGNGGRLGGTGTLGNVVVASGGILAPGNSPGTLTATGSAIFRTGSFYDLELASSGATDLLRVTGTATIEGGTVRIAALDPETNYTNGQRYTILTATGGRTGTFAGLTETSSFLDFALSYDANNAFVTVSVVRTFPDVAQTFNQRQASTALMRFNTGGADALAVYNQLLLLDAPSARAAFDLSSGEIYAVTLASAVRQGDALAGRLLARANETMGANWGLWGGVSGLDGRVDADGNGARYRHDGFGGELGIDYRGAANGWAVGVGGGYTKFDSELGARRSNADGDGWHLGGYARFGTGGAGLTISASAVYASFGANVTRTIAFGTLNRTARANVDANGFTVAAEARYGLRASTTWSLGPMVRVSHARSTLDDFAENGADSLNLSAADNDENRTRLGIGAFARFEGAGSLFDLAAGYAAGGGDPTEVTLAMAGAGANPFRVRSAEGDGSGAFAQLGAGFALGGGWSLDANLRGTMGRNERTLIGNVALTWQF